jgi:hypothetical protein
MQSGEVEPFCDLKIRFGLVINAKKKLSNFSKWPKADYREKTAS